MQSSKDGTLEEEHVETLIIGGGIAGLACARRLHEAGRRFLLVTEDLGGRLAISDRSHPLGAVIVNDDYVHIKQYAKKAHVSRPWNSYIWDGNKARNSLLRLNPFKLARLGKVLAEFRDALNQLRVAAPYQCQKVLMEADPFLQKLVAQQSVDFVREYGLEDLTEGFLGPVVSAVFLCDWREMNAFHFCIGISCTSNGAFNADWSDTLQNLTREYSDKIVLDSVNALIADTTRSTYHIECRQKNYVAQQVVLAVPATRADALLNESSSARAVSCKVFHIEGKRKKRFKPGKTLLLGAGHDIKLFYALPDGVDIVYASIEKPNLDDYYIGHTVVAERFWQPATQLSGQQWRPLQPTPNLFTIGDYNICGLEDAYLTGMFAANKIIEVTAGTVG